jgi:hypothetical protein
VEAVAAKESKKSKQESTTNARTIPAVVSSAAVTADDEDDLEIVYDLDDSDYKEEEEYVHENEGNESCNYNDNDNDNNDDDDDEDEIDISELVTCIQDYLVELPEVHIIDQPSKELLKMSPFKVSKVILDEVVTPTCSTLFETLLSDGFVHVEFMTNNASEIKPNRLADTSLPSKTIAEVYVVRNTITRKVKKAGSTKDRCYRKKILIEQGIIGTND